MTELVAVLFDTETTGLIKPKAVDINDQPQVIEYYAMKVIHRADGIIEKIDELETYLKPKVPFNESIIGKITGIYNATVANAQSFQDFYPDWLKFHVDVKRIVAHNCAFDVAMMKNEILRLAHDEVIDVPEFESTIKMIDSMEKLCTVQKTMFIEQRRLSLTNLYKELFGVPFEGAHRARGDVEALFRCYQELYQRGVIKA